MESLAASESLQRHPIAVVVDRTGISQDVLRIWERRYGAVQPSRGADGRRLYSDQDIDRLNLINQASRAGRSVGNVARLPTEELRQLVDEDERARAQVDRERLRSNERSATGAGSTAVTRTENVVARALQLTKSFDAPQLFEEFIRQESNLGVANFLEQVAMPLLRAVGDEWEEGRLTPSQEHLVSSLLHDMAVQTMRRFAHRDVRSRVLVATPAGDRHAIGAAVVGAIAAIEGWEVIYVGADLPSHDIAGAAIATGARLVALSIIYLDNADHVVNEVRALRRQLPASIDIIVGGAGALQLKSALHDNRIQVESTLSDWTRALRHRRLPAGDAVLG